MRPIAPDDKDALQRFHSRQSPESIYLRFFAAVKHLSDSDLVRYTEVDHVDRVALVVTLRGEIIGIGRYDRTRDAHDAGVQLLVGSDSGGVLGHGIIHDELDEFAAAGLTATEILDAATWAPRRFLGVPGLEDGAPADLLVVPRDPRADHRALRERTRVVLGGRIVA